MVEFERIYWDRASLIRAILARISHYNKLPMSSPSTVQPKTYSNKSLPLQPLSSHRWERRGNETPMRSNKNVLPSRSVMFVAWISA